MRSSHVRLAAALALRLGLAGSVSKGTSSRGGLNFGSANFTVNAR